MNQIGENIEQTVNHALGFIMKRKYDAWDVYVERTNMFVETDGKPKPDTPDIAVFVQTVPMRSKTLVVIEVKFDTNSRTDVESDARKRLGEKISDGNEVEVSVAVRVPDSLKYTDQCMLPHEIMRCKNIEFKFCKSGDSSKYSKSDNGWVVDNVYDLMAKIDYAHCLRTDGRFLL